MAPEWCRPPFCPGNTCIILGFVLLMVVSALQAFTTTTKRRRRPKPRTYVRNPPCVAPEVLNFIHLHCDVPVRRKLEASLGWPPVVYPIQKPKVDLFLHKRHFLQPEVRGWALWVVLPIGEHKMYQYHVLHSRSRYFWRRCWPLRKWTLPADRVQMACVPTEPTEEWEMVDRSDRSQFFNRVFNTKTLMRSTLWLIQIDGAIRIREAFCVAGKEPDLWLVPDPIALYDGLLAKMDMRRVKAWEPRWVRR